MKNILIKCLLAGIGGCLASFILLFLTKQTGEVLIMAPFGASCVILFALPEAPLAQPRNVIGGHFITALIGMIALKFFPHCDVTTAIAVGLGISCMVITKTTHPPAGANPLLILLSGKDLGWMFLAFPVVSGAIILVAVAWVYHSLTTKSYHPKLPWK